MALGGLGAAPLVLSLTALCLLCQWLGGDVTAPRSWGEPGGCLSVTASLWEYQNRVGGL